MWWRDHGPTLLTCSPCVCVRFLLFVPLSAFLCCPSGTAYLWSVPSVYCLSLQGLLASSCSCSSDPCFDGLVRWFHVCGPGLVVTHWGCFPASLHLWRALVGCLPPRGLDTLYLWSSYGLPFGWRAWAGGGRAPSRADPLPLLRGGPS